MTPYDRLLGLGLVTGALAQGFPGPDEFIRAAKWRAAVVGDYIYLDGGEVSQEGEDFRPSDPINSTLSIDCSTSWSPDNVEIAEISKPETMPVLSNQNMFVDLSTDSFYVWGGDAPFAESTDASDLWRFAVDGEGGGSWNREAVADAELFLSIDRTERGAYTNTPDGGYVFGGEVIDSDAKRTGENKKGYVSFDFDTKEWEYETTVPYSQDGSLWGATATYVPGFGSRELIFLLGGMERRREQASAYLDFGRVHFFDPASQTWYEQSTTGKVPPRRHDHCAIGVGDKKNETYEIFVYGGANDDSKTVSGEVYSLSIPGFHWTLLSDEDDRAARCQHVCVNVGGNSQLVSLGGHLYNITGEDWDTKDLYPLSLGIFDLNTLEWKDSYDADADEYRTHENITSWYEDGGLDSVEWSSPEVRALFLTSETEDDPESGDPRSTPVAAIAGGTVGGVAGLALIVGVAWFVWRRRAGAVAEVEATGPTQELKGSPLYPSYTSPASELQSNNPAELAAERTR